MVVGIWGLKQTYEDMKTVKCYKDVLCEFFLTFLLMYAIMMTQYTYPDRPSNVFVGNIIGLYVITLIEGFAHVELVIMNPNVNLMFVLTKTISIYRAILYTGAQLLAVSLACLMINNITPENLRGQVGASGPRENVSNVANWVSECHAVALLCTVIIGTGDADRKRVMLPNIGIGFAILSVCVVGAPWGVSLNPAVAFGLCLVSNDWSRYWIYCTSGAVGATLAVLIYHFLAADKGLCGKKDIFDRFPSMNMSISRAVSRVDDSGVVRMESVTDIIERENQRELQLNNIHANGLPNGLPNGLQNGLQNGYQINQSPNDVRL